MKQPGWGGGLGRINTETGGIRDLMEIAKDRTERRKEKEAKEEKKTGGGESRKQEKIQTQRIRVIEKQGERRK